MERYAFSRIWTELGEIQSISPYLVRVRENVDQNNTECGYLLRSVNYHKLSLSTLALAKLSHVYPIQNR